MFKQFHHWDVVAILLSVAVVTGFEFLGVFTARYITLTHLIKQFIPMPCRIMILAWLWWHFAISDLFPAYHTRLP